MNTDLSFITNQENSSLKDRFEILIKDTFKARAQHQLRTFWHFSEKCEVYHRGSNYFTVLVGSDSIDVWIDPCFSVQHIKGGENPITGWLSRGYHHKVPCVTLIGHCTSVGDKSFKHRISISSSGEA